MITTELANDLFIANDKANFAITTTQQDDLSSLGFCSSELETLVTLARELFPYWEDVNGFCEELIRLMRKDGSVRTHLQSLVRMIDTKSELTSYVSSQGRWIIQREVVETNKVKSFVSSFTGNNGVAVPYESVMNVTSFTDGKFDPFFICEFPRHMMKRFQLFDSYSGGNVAQGLTLLGLLVSFGPEHSLRRSNLETPTLDALPLSKDKGLDFWTKSMSSPEKWPWLIASSYADCDKVMTHGSPKTAWEIHMDIHERTHRLKSEQGHLPSESSALLILLSESCCQELVQGNINQITRFVIFLHNLAQSERDRLVEPIRHITQHVLRQRS